MTSMMLIMSILISVFASRFIDLYMLYLHQIIPSCSTGGKVLSDMHLLDLDTLTWRNVTPRATSNRQLWPKRIYGHTSCSISRRGMEILKGEEGEIDNYFSESSDDEDDVTTGKNGHTGTFSSSHRSSKSKSLVPDSVLKKEKQETLKKSRKEAKRRQREAADGHAAGSDSDDEHVIMSDDDVETEPRRCVSKLPFFSDENLLL